MLTVARTARLYVRTSPTDLRKGFDGLTSLVAGEFEMEPRSGDLYVFLNRRGNQVRILFWDCDGYCVMAKRLEAGTFRRVQGRQGEVQVEIDSWELGMLLEGMDAEKVRRRKRYRVTKQTNMFVKKVLDSPC